MSSYKLTTELKPKGDQPQAIKKLVDNLSKGIQQQVLLGATGTGKTFTIANVIAKTNKKTLVIVNNKTLAAQLYSEFKDLFKENKVEYFISYFDYYQPEAYLPQSDTFIEKTSKTNQEIEMLRLSTINSLASEDKVIVIASVAAIYPSVSPQDFNRYRIILQKNAQMTIKQFRYDLVRLQYERNDIDLKLGSFRVKGDVIEVALGFEKAFHLRVSFDGDKIEDISKVDSLTGQVIEKWTTYVIVPASEYITNHQNHEEAIDRIENELANRVRFFNDKNKLLEKQRIKDRTRHDIESIREFGHCNGIENYAYNLELRQPGSTPYTIFDYMGDDFLLIVDESHMTLPQVKGMYFGDRSRKETLVEFGFRLPSALENRPLNFEEFNNKIKNVIYVSATPSDYEIEKSEYNVVQQVVRPTGLVDPIIEVLPTKGQIDELIDIIRNQVKQNNKTFINVLTIRMAEELTSFLIERKLKVAYLHNELKTLERTKIINDLRKGKYDAIVGINLLREGLDVPEVSKVIIFDADKQGFFRSYEALIQLFGRCARNKDGKVIMFADKISQSMKKAIDETNRRREIQEKYNLDNNILPQTIVKPIFDDISSKDEIKMMDTLFHGKNKMSEKNKSKAIALLKKHMLEAAKMQDYEKAAYFRDMIFELEAKIK